MTLLFVVPNNKSNYLAFSFRHRDTGLILYSLSYGDINPWESS